METMPFDKTTSEQRMARAIGCMSQSMGKIKRVWCVIDAVTGEVVTWSVSKQGAKKSQRRLGFPCILAKLEPAD